jgi:hypothetical protein
MIIEDKVLDAIEAKANIKVGTPPALAGQAEPKAEAEEETGKAEAASKPAKKKKAEK